MSETTGKSHFRNGNIETVPVKKNHLPAACLSRRYQCAKRYSFPAAAAAVQCVPPPLSVKQRRGISQLCCRGDGLTSTLLETHLHQGPTGVALLRSQLRLQLSHPLLHFSPFPVELSIVHLVGFAETLL